MKPPSATPSSFESVSPNLRCPPHPQMDPPDGRLRAPHPPLRRRQSLPRVHSLQLAAIPVLAVFLLEVSSQLFPEQSDQSSSASPTSWKRLNLYGTLVLHWVNSQLTLDTAMGTNLTTTATYGGSIVEVYRIVEEAVDHFFGLEVPMRSFELSSLCHGVDNAFQVYANNVVEKLGFENLNGVLDNFKLIILLREVSQIEKAAKFGVSVDVVEANLLCMAWWFCYFIQCSGVSR